MRGLVRLPPSLRYLAARLLQKDSGEAAPYLREGLAIEIRARRLGVHWKPHIDASRAAQERWTAAATAGGERLAVLGAGRLLDLSRALPDRFRHLRLVDADPLCRPFWRAAFPGRHEAVIADVTACLADWTRRLAALRGAGLAQTLDAIRGWRAVPVAGPDWLRDCDAVLSLNLLSQIAVGWQDRVEAHLIRRFGAAVAESHDDEWVAAVEPSARSLVEAHLAMLNGSGAGRVLLIADLEYLDYQGAGRTFSRRRWEPPPVRWQDGQWLAEAALRLECHSYPALFGIDHPAPLLPDYRETWSERWLWHIRPQGTEPPEGTGSIHLVGAFSFEKNPSPVYGAK